MQRAPNRSILRITLATAVAVLTSTTLIGCNQDGDTATTTASPGEAARDERAGEVQPSAQQPMGQQEMAGQQGTQPGMGQQGMGQQGMQPGMGQQGMGQPGTGAQDIMAARGSEACPMMVEGVSIDVVDTADGVALRFTSPTQADVDDLRNRVQHMARMYEMHTGEQAEGGSMMWHRMGHTRADQDQAGAAGQAKGPTGVMPAATVTVEEIDNGVQMVLKPKDNAQLATLREHARDHERHMKSGECWMAQQTGAQGQGAQGQGQTGAGQVGDDKPGHRPGESAPGDGRPKT